MNNSTEALGFETAELPEYIAWTSLVLCSIILFVGILGNLLVIIVILTSKVLRSSTNLFLLNLSIADLLVLAICTSSSLVEIVTRSDKWILGKVHTYTFKPRTFGVFLSHRCLIIQPCKGNYSLLLPFKQVYAIYLIMMRTTVRRCNGKKLDVLGFLKVKIRFRITRLQKKSLPVFNLRNSQ